MERFGHISCVRKGIEDERDNLKRTAQGGYGQVMGTGLKTRKKKEHLFQMKKQQLEFCPWLISL